VSSRDELIGRARERANGGGLHAEWGERVETLEQTGDLFVGRYRGEASDDAYAGQHSRRICLLWDEDGEERWYRGKWSLNQELDRARPEIGDTIAIAVGEAWEGREGNSSFYYGVEVEPCSDPLPGQAVAGPGGGTGHDIPFMPTAA
jgi:hypothetical protein